LSDYTESSQNRRVLSDEDIGKIRKQVLTKKLKANEVLYAVWSESKQTNITLSTSTINRVLKRKWGDEPSMIAAVPKPMRIMGNASHYNRCRKHEAEFWLAKDDQYIEGMWFGDESKITFREHKNRAIDIVWTLRGTAGATNWYRVLKISAPVVGSGGSMPPGSTTGEKLYALTFARHCMSAHAGRGKSTFTCSKALMKSSTT
jgi:hypothetical protein